MKSINIILTSLGNLGNRLSHKYFYFEDFRGDQYCDGIGVAEAGTKYILSQVPVNEIIVLGSGASYEKGEELKKLVLKDWVDFDSENIDSLSEYSFFRYRISQYLDGLDLEGNDVIFDIDDDRRSAIIDAYKKFRSGLSTGDEVVRPDKTFHYLSKNRDAYEKFLNEIPLNDEKELRWLKRYIYNELSESMKLTSLEYNDGLEICFIPTSKKIDSTVPVENVIQIVNSIQDNDADIINLYIDMQGLGSSDGYTILAILSMLSNDSHSNIRICEIITTHDDPTSFSGTIDNNEMNRYEINKLVSGMNAFIQYGKVDLIKEYWESRKIQNERIDFLLYAMRCVDDGISLCNIQDLEFGIALLKKVFKDTVKEELPEFESNVFTILEKGIRLDYGKLLDGEELNILELIQWALRKKFYQQTMTIIESKIPEDIVSKGIFFYAIDEESRETYLQDVNRLYWEELPKTRYSYRHISHYFVKFYGRYLLDYRDFKSDKQRNFADLRIAELDGTPNLSKAFSKLYDHKEKVGEMLYSYYTLGDIRNTINHALDTKKNDINNVNVHSENENIKLLVTSINKFIDLYKECLELLETTESTLTPLFVSEEEFNDYTFKHKVFGNGGKKFGNKKFGDKKFGKKFDDKKSDDQNSGNNNNEGGEGDNKKFGDSSFKNKKYKDKKFNNCNQSAGSDSITVNSSKSGNGSIKITIEINN